ncbi:MAG: CsgG/HfaB family protein [Janthinobacterium lividum]
MKPDSTCFTQAGAASCPRAATHSAWLVPLPPTLPGWPCFAIAGLVLLSAFGLGGCATETSQTVLPQQVASAGPQSKPVPVQRLPLVVGKFDNRSSFLRGLFSDGVDRLGGQAKTILVTHLQQARRFQVMDRDNLDETGKESQFTGQSQRIKGADFVITGDVTEFGRKEAGDQQLFGILGRGKTQVAYAKVALNVVDALTSEVIFSVQGAGEFALSNREVVGFGGTAGYDSTLNGKVLDLAIREAVNRLVDGVDSGAWMAASRK